jgi:hypothetical protein
LFALYQKWYVLESSTAGEAIGRLFGITTPIGVHLIVGFFGCCCVLNRIDVGRGSMMLTNFGMGWGDHQRGKAIGRFVLTILLMAWTIVVLQHFFK